MSTLLQMLNHVLSAWLAASPADGPWQVRHAALTPEGGHVRGRVDHPLAEGEFVLSIKVEEPRDGRQDVILRVDKWPEKLPPVLEALRPVLENSSVRVQLCFPQEALEETAP